MYNRVWRFFFLITFHIPYLKEEKKSYLQEITNLEIHLVDQFIKRILWYRLKKNNAVGSNSPPSHSGISGLYWLADHFFVRIPFTLGPSMKPCEEFGRMVWGWFENGLII